jgi:GNAT superfamily N-acetyltransferase
VAGKKPLRAKPARGVEIHPVDAKRWPDLVRLFGPRGACGGCWCMWPRLRGGDYRRGLGTPNRNALRKLVQKPIAPGLLAYLGGEPVAWCAVAPRTEYLRVESSRVMAPLDDRPAWSVPCFFVRRDLRGTGLTLALLRAATRYAAAHGARLVEGYPIDAKSRGADTFLWHGHVRTFERAGFREAARRSPTRPLMRKNVRPTGRG